MTGFDLPGIGGIDPMQFRSEMLRHASAAPPAIQDPERIGRGPALPDRGGDGFAGALANAVDRVQSLQTDAAAKARGLALGEDVDLHDVMIAANKSEAAFNLMLEVRNKLVDAWEKLSRSVM